VRHTGLDLAVESALEEEREVHLEFESVFDHVGIDQDLVRNAEVEGKLILVHELAVLLWTFSAHDEGVCAVLLIVEGDAMIERCEMRGLTVVATKAAGNGIQQKNEPEKGPQKI
jgi:hypothetical protein